MEEKLENVVEETTETNQKVEEVVETTEQNENVEFDSANDDSVIKINLDKKPEDETKEEIKNDNINDGGVVEVVENTGTTQKQEEVQPETETQEIPVVEEITEEEVSNESLEEKTEELAVEAKEAIEENVETGTPIPENIQKLMNFMDETGGDLSDYVRLNQDYSKLSQEDLLYEYYKQTKPHLNNEEINFLMEDQFSYDEETEDERDIKRKRLALKEQVANAKSHLDGQKSKYYKDIKAGSKLTPEQQKAIDFFNKYNENLEVTQKASKRNSDIFTQKTNNVFNSEFKGFEYNVGDKKYRFNVNNVEEVKNTQSDINNFTKKFLDKEMALKDAVGYHKSLYTAMNADAIARHFYEQGKSDALKDSITKSKNVNMNPRQGHNEIQTGGVKARVIGESSSDFKFKIKNNK